MTPERITAQAPVQSKPIAPGEQASPPPRPPGGYRLLLIEDDAPLRRCLSEWFRLHHHTVIPAAGGVAGVVAFTGTPVDCVVTDLEMPDLSGWEVAGIIHRLDPTVPIVLITGNPEAAEADPRLRALVQAILIKPFGLTTLLKTMEGLRIERRHL